MELHTAVLQDPDTVGLVLEQKDWKERPELHTVALVYSDMQPLHLVEPDSNQLVAVVDPQQVGELHM
jgi:hypothetical protein